MKGAPEPRPLPTPRPRGSAEQHKARRPLAEAWVQALLLLIKSPKAQFGRLLESSNSTHTRRSKCLYGRSLCTASNGLVLDIGCPYPTGTMPVAIPIIYQIAALATRLAEESNRSICVELGDHPLRFWPFSAEIAHVARRCPTCAAGFLLAHGGHLPKGTRHAATRATTGGIGSLLGCFRGSGQATDHRDRPQGSTCPKGNNIMCANRGYPNCLENLAPHGFPVF